MLAISLRGLTGHHTSQLLVVPDDQLWALHTELMVSRCLWMCCTAAEPGGGLHVSWGMIWGIVSIEKAKAPTNAFFGAATRTSLPAKAISGDHHHITTARQELILPSQCTYPPRPAVFALHSNEAQVGERAQHSTIADNRPIFTQHANCRPQPASPQPSATNGRCPYSLYLSSYRPLRSPIRSFHSRYLGGATPVSLAFTE
ncbi:hypothetical protein BU25DRAFT_100347 [Macroventuria anomochaeta]|uniref:Uncharacterized protein n=1 Tax=Macroventuria anomochaeta TaxID=301207 RepID=A0ACB6RYZ6_9PLEO|nr:uncharacterized protein BU25DRAFT_100347 [Macroventuria anomochaeta]KAF2626487.1 hypothetical protein BU25DRAFT_100347 [Macroventuria anomochaeta]